MSKNNEESIIEVKDLSKSFGDHGFCGRLILK